MKNPIALIPISGIPEITPGCDFSGLIADAVRGMEERILPGDIVVLSSKAVAKWQGLIHDAATIAPGPKAMELSNMIGKEPAYCQLILDATKEIIRLAPGVVICRTKQGLVLANAGVDASNTGGRNRYITLPENLDALAEEIRLALEQAFGAPLAVIIGDTFGRPWRNGQVNLAVGLSGMSALIDHRGLPDDNGVIMRKTMSAVADELASAADLASAKTGRIPAVIVRGYDYPKGSGLAADLQMPANLDLFGSNDGTIPYKKLLERRSIRRFDGREVAGDLLDQVIQAGLHAPSAHDTRPWRFSLIKSQQAMRRFRIMLEDHHVRDMKNAGFSPGEISARRSRSREIFLSASAFIVLFGASDVPFNRLAGDRGIEERLTAQSVALAGGQMLTAAFFLGLGACWFAAPLFCSGAVSEFCGWGSGFAPQGMIALGYPAQEPKEKAPVTDKGYVNLF